MNIYVVMKRTFDTEEKVEIKDGRVDEEGAEFVINLMMNMPLKKRSY